MMADEARPSDDAATAGGSSPQGRASPSSGGFADRTAPVRPLLTRSAGGAPARKFVADEEDDLFERDYINLVLRRPFRSTARTWLMNGTLITGILVMPFGPVMLLAGLVLGAILGVSAGLLADLVKLQRKQTLIAGQQTRMAHLMRWAEFHFDEGQFQILFKVVQEYEALACLGAFSRTARRQLRMLYKFLCRTDVQHCLCVYLEAFFTDWRQRTIPEVLLCSTVFEVCLQCCDSLNKPRPPTVRRMGDLLTANPVVRSLFAQGELLRRRQRGKAVKENDWLAYADARGVTPGGALRSDLRKIAGQLVPQAEGDEQKEEEEGEGEEEEDEEEEDEAELLLLNGGSAEQQPISPVSPPSPTSLASPSFEPVGPPPELPGATVVKIESAPADHWSNFSRTSGHSLRELELTRASSTALRDGAMSPSPSAPPLHPSQPLHPSFPSHPSHSSFHPSFPSHPSHPSHPVQPVQPPQTPQPAQPAHAPAEVPEARKLTREESNVAPGHHHHHHRRVAVEQAAGSGSQPPKRLFRSLEDLVKFDSVLKQQTPIGAYEVEFLRELQSFAEGEKLWDCVVNKNNVRVYKKRGDSPVVLVKAYAKLAGIPPLVVAHHIRHIPTRAKWDTTFEEWKLVASRDDNEVIYCLMRAPWPVSNRDFLQWRRTTITDDQCTLIMMRSAVHPDVPERTNCVRADTVISGYIISPGAEPGSTDLFLCTQTDVKGLIPKWVVNQGAQKSPVQWTENLRKVCLKYVSVHGTVPPKYTLD